MGYKAEYRLDFINYFVCGCLIVLALTVSVRAEVSRSLDQTLKVIVKLEKEIPAKQTIHNLSKTGELKEQITLIRDRAIADQKVLEVEITRVQGLIRTIENDESDEEETNKTDQVQDEVIIQETQSLQNEYSQSLANLTKIRLIQAKAKDLLHQINSLNVNTFSDFLFQKLPLPIKKESLEQLAQEWEAIMGMKASWGEIWLFIIALLPLMVCGMLYRGESVDLQVSDSENDKSAIYKTLGLIFGALSLTICVYGVFYGVGTEDQSPYLVGILLHIYSLIGVVVLYRSLGRFQQTSLNGVLAFEYISLAIRAALVCILVMGLLSYVVLAAYIVSNLIITIAGIISFLFLRRFIEKGIYRLNKKKTLVSEVWLPIISELVLGIVIFICVAHFWGFSFQHYIDFCDTHKNGINIGDTNINLKNVFFAVISFGVCIYLFRLIRWFLEQRIFKYIRPQRSVAEVSISLLRYSGVAIALITGLGVLGLQVQDLALIVGALSVGIGFGLQNIINNFVSGLILLFERPVKVGDWVSLDSGLEGYVKKIRIRSTEIETFQRASVVIPNADLISKPITNWTLHDHIGRIEIAVGIAYGSDTEMVREILLNIATENPGIRQIPAPTVLFLDFADSSLNFELRCFVRNINDKMSIQSDLRFAIDRAFREHNIEIPFPQQDLHVKTGNINTV